MLRRDGDELVADCRLTGEPPLPGQAEPQVTTHFTGAGPLGAGRRATGAAPARAAAAAERHECSRRRHLPGLLPRPGLPGARAGVARDGRVRSACSPTDLPPRPRPGRAARRRRAAPDRALLPDRRHLGDRHDGRFGLPQHIDRSCLRGTASATAGRLDAVVTRRRGRLRDAECRRRRRATSCVELRRLPHRRAARAASSRKASDPWPRRWLTASASSESEHDARFERRRHRQPGRAGHAAASTRLRELNRERGARLDTPSRCSPSPIGARCSSARPTRRCASARRPLRRRATAAARSATSTTTGSSAALASRRRRGRVGGLGLRRRACRVRRAVRAARRRLHRARSGDVMRRLGDKIGAKRLAEQAGVPVVPWSGGPVRRSTTRAAHAERSATR